MDEFLKMVIICMGDVVWVVGIVELGDDCLQLCVVCLYILCQVMCDWFLLVGDFDDVQFWVGCCFMMFDGLFLLGFMLVCNLFLNLGYGLIGWVMLLGFGCVVVDFIMGILLVIDFDGLILVCYL